MAYYRKKRNSISGGFDFLKQNWLFILIGIYVVPLVYKLIIGNKAKIMSADHEAEIKQLEAIQGNPELQDQYMNEATTHSQRQLARDIYHHTGFAYSWWDPRRWTENDEDIYLLLKDFAPIPNGLKIAYYTISAGRDMKADLLQVLDSNYYSKLKW